MRPTQGIHRQAARVLIGSTLATTLLLGLCNAVPPNASGSTSERQVPSPWDWPTYGHDAQHTFHGPTTLNQSSVTSLKVAWFFPTGDSVSATPTVVNGTVYVGSWDDYFYALNFETGALRWKYKLRAHCHVGRWTGHLIGLVRTRKWLASQPGHIRRRLHAVRPQRRHRSALLEP
jgi:glucose dehydrogenase